MTACCLSSPVTVYISWAYVQVDFQFLFIFHISFCHINIRHIAELDTLKTLKLTQFMEQNIQTHFAHAFPPDKCEIQLVETCYATYDCLLTCFMWKYVCGRQMDYEIERKCVGGRKRKEKVAWKRAVLTSMKRDMLIMAWSISLKTSRHVNAVSWVRVSSECLDKKLITSSTLHWVPANWALKTLAVALFRRSVCVWKNKEMEIKISFNIGKLQSNGGSNES